MPNYAPKVDIPEFEGGIPGIPEVRELPEYTEPIGTVPNDAPVLDKPEWSGGTVPNEAPVHYKPEFEGGVIPNDAPILDLPELEIPVDPEKPVVPKEAPSKPVGAPKAKKEITTVSYNFDSDPKEAVKTPTYSATLPNTGEKEGIMSTLGLVVIAAGIASLALTFKKYNEGEEE